MVVPWLEPSDVDALTELWARVGPAEPPTEVMSTVNLGDAAVNREVEAAIHERFEPKAAALFDRCELSGATFIVKGIGPASALRPHQDWNNVDEAASSSAGIWCPLVDADATNGPLEVLAGSHRVGPSVRGFGAESLHLEFTPDLDPFLTRVEVDAGDAVVFLHNLFHGSRANLSGSARVTAVAGVVPIEAQRIAYWHQDGAPPARWRKLGVDADFYNTGIEALAAGAVPDGAEDLGTVEVAPLSAGDVLEGLRRLRRGP